MPGLAVVYSTSQERNLSGMTVHGIVSSSDIMEYLKEKGLKSEKEYVEWLHLRDKMLKEEI